MAEKKILIVDDDIGIVKTFEEILSLEGYVVETAGTAKEAISKIKKNSYDVALLDIKIPDKDGTEILKDANFLRPNMVKIMVTGFADVDNAVKSLNEGASAYIMKPVNPEELLKVISLKLTDKVKSELINEDKVSEWIENRLNNLDES